MGLFDMFQRENREKGIDISHTHTAKVIEVKKTIETNADKLEHIIMLSENYPEFVEQFEDILIDIKYANPVVDNEIKAIDFQISNKLDDLKLLLSRGKIRSDLAINHAIRDLKELVHQREMKE